MKVTDGMWWGVVEDTADPEKKNRIRAKVPDMLGSEVSEWAEPDSLAISKWKKGDKIWFRFLNGDTRHPVYHVPYLHEKKGTLYNAEDGLELKHPTGPMRVVATQGSISVTSEASSIATTSETTTAITAGTTFTVTAGSTARMGGSSSSVNATGGSIHCQGASGSGYVPCVASDFQEGSSSELKDNVRPLDFDPVQAIQDAPAMLWNYRPEFAEDSRTRIGPIAETLPELVRRDKNVDLAALVGVLWAAVDHLSRRVQELEDRDK